MVITLLSQILFWYLLFTVVITLLWLVILFSDYNDYRIYGTKHLHADFIQMASYWKMIPLWPIILIKYIITDSIGMYKEYSKPTFKETE